ncbi:MAG: TIGR00730 family Rossman fold protein [Flavobacteriales bacterium]
MQVCVYCASSDQIRPVFFEATEKLAKALVDANINVVYGGGGSGLMGCLATTMVRHGGNIKGIMPHFMREVEWAHKEVKEFHFVADMHERKKMFLENTDALIALAGGTGTFEELFEAITLKKLGLFLKPIVILNTGGYYDPLVQMLQNAIDEGFMGELHAQMWTVVNEPEEVLPAIANAPQWSEDAIKFANPGK